MFTRNYRFGAYRKQIRELTDLAAQVQSEKLSTQLHDAALCIFKLIGLVEAKEELLARRMQGQFRLLREWAPAVLDSTFPHIHATCHDGDPKFWREDCPRCLAVVIAAVQDTPNPYTELPESVQEALFTALNPKKRRRKSQLATTSSNLHL